MKKTSNNLPDQKIRPLYGYAENKEKQPVFSVTGTGGDPTTTITTILTSTHIGHK